MATFIHGRLVVILRANSGVSDIVAANVFGARFPQAPILPSVLVQRQGGPAGGGESPMRKATLVTKCFAKTSTLAAALHEAVRTALVGTPDTNLDHQTTIMAAGVESITEEVGPQDIIDPDGPDKGTPYTLGFWNAMFK